MHTKRPVPVSATAALAGVLVLRGRASAATTTSTSWSPGATTHRLAIRPVLRPAWCASPGGHRWLEPGRLAHVTQAC